MLKHVFVSQTMINMCISLLYNIGEDLSKKI